MLNQEKSPRYVRIAIDIANRIISLTLKESQKIKGRSTLAGEYNVSPETIRRSLALLSDMEVVEVLPNSGVVIKSRDKALDFINKFSSKENIGSLRAEITKLIDERNKLNAAIQEKLDLVLEQSFSFSSNQVINQYEYKISEKSKFVDKMISEIKFWQNTGATIIGVKRARELLVSPGPYFAFERGDIIIFAGNENVYERVENFSEGL